MISEEGSSGTSSTPRSSDITDPDEEENRVLPLVKPDTPATPKINLNRRATWIMNDIIGETAKDPSMKPSKSKQELDSPMVENLESDKHMKLAQGRSALKKNKKSKRSSSKQSKQSKQTS